jgi:acyl-CoA thioesterase
MEAKQIVKTMMEKDFFSQWLGIEVLESQAGNCKLKMPIKKEMLNGFGILHGGIAFSLADSCFAFACNGFGALAVSLQATIHFLKKAGDSEILMAESKLVSQTSRFVVMDIEIREMANGHLIASFRGTASVNPEKDWDSLQVKN